MDPHFWQVSHSAAGRDLTRVSTLCIAPSLALPSLFHFPSRLLSLPAARFALFLRSGSLKSVLILLSLDVFSREDPPFRTVVSRVTCGEGYRPTCPRYILWDPMSTVISLREYKDEMSCARLTQVFWRVEAARLAVQHHL